MRSIVILVVMFAVVCLASGVAVAEETETLLYAVNCHGGVPLRLWLANEDATCTTSGSGFLCDNTTSDFASANCATGCDQVQIGNLVGCFYGDGNPNFNLPNFTVTCSDGGRKFDLKGREGDTCTQIDEGTEGNPNITGGECHKEGEPTNISTSADCQTGCGTTKPGADCKER